eukprot:GFYU01005527.1.p1 GENE.GFYU01005527.1~~GFYU01005527.1.p1  ORF type:complete len:664 (-),score=206.12 GFYU01005527.1:68-2020(-)
MLTKVISHRHKDTRNNNNVALDADSDDEAPITGQGEIDCYPSGECIFSGKKMSVAVGDTLVLESASVTLNRGHCYGLIGPNGAGKTTLMRFLHQCISESCDEISVKYVGQTDAELSSECTDDLLEYTIKGDDRHTKLLAEVERLEAECSADTAERLCEALEELELDDTEDRAKKMLKKLRFPETSVPVSSLSGGWRSRLEIARALVAQPELLFLDEPTNHLDIEAILKLGGILRDIRDKTTVVVVSHDAAFLDFVVTDITCVHKQTVQHVPGSYANFEEKAEQYKQFHEHLYDKRQDGEKKLMQSIQQQTSRAKKSGNDKALKNAGARQKKIERVGMYREDGKRYKTRSLKVLSEDALRLPAFAEAVKVNGELTLKLPAECDVDEGAQTTGGPPLLSLSGLSVGYGTKTVLRVGDKQVCAGDRIAMVGINGCGKTTLMRAIANDSTVIKGSINRGGTKLALVDQNQLAMLSDHLDKTPVDWFMHRHPEQFTNAGDVRQYLGRFGLGGGVATTPIEYLSGGVRVRVVLADVFVNPPDILMLDEPTNHLDGETIIALGNALKRFSGAVVGVSHNCAFLLDVFTQLWVCENGQVAVHTHAEAKGLTFADHFERFAETLVRKKDKDHFRVMLQTRAARSAIVAQQPRAMSSLII